MKKYTRRYYPLLLTAIFVIAAAASVPRGCVYGSTTDWLPQHIALAETIRAACAKQGTLLPAFLPLGGGSNGFLFSYYGYLRPDILIGCVLQRVPMLFLVIGYRPAISLPCCCFTASFSMTGKRSLRLSGGACFFCLRHVFSTRTGR